MEETNKDLVIWMITPPNNINNFISEVGKRWCGRVILFSCYDVREERKKNGYISQCENMDEIFILENMVDGNKFAKEYIRSHIDSIYVFVGLIKGPAKYMHYLKRWKGNNIAVITEKPHLNSDLGIKYYIKKIIGKNVYRYIYRSSMNYVHVLFPISLTGKCCIKELGWTRDNMYSFMYADNGQRISTYPRVNEVINFIHVGRINYRHHGYDIIMQAFDRMIDLPWVLTIVGNYGENKDEVIKWADKHENVNDFWSADSVTKNLCEYDVYICAAREDSWHGQINQAINAGIGVITTDCAGSNELVSEGGMGIVIKENSVTEMETALRFAIQNKQQVLEWKKKSIRYAPRISAENVADYFCGVLEYAFCNSEKAPECPWIEGEC